jgi:ubiquinone/menaquinone biosynthesis C-methylase UbiE
MLPDTGVEPLIDLAMIAQFVSEVGDSGPPNVLDAGCGAGRMISYLHSLNGGLSVTGLDLSQEMLKQARAAHPEAKLAEGELAALPFADREFDGVLAWYPIIHTPPHELYRIFAQFHRVLRPGGVALLAYQAPASGPRPKHMGTTWSCTRTCTTAHTSRQRSKPPT